MITKTIWISYDLGVGGDYEGLYAWLDNRGAIECGDSLACINLTIEKEDDNLLITKLKTSMSEHIKIDSKSRVYVIRRVVDDAVAKVKGRFIFGSRKGNPWEGFGSKQEVNSDDGE